MISNSRPFLLRLLCFFMVLVILFSSIIVPVYASEILLYEIIAATARNLIASLIRACGVYVADGIEDTLSDGLSVWESLVDYVVAQIPAEYLYINAAGEYFVKMILQDGLYYAPRNLVEYVLEVLTEPKLDTNDEIVQPIGYGYDSMDYSHIEVIKSILSACKSRGYEYAPYLRNLPYCTFAEYSTSDGSIYYYAVFSQDSPASMVWLSGSYKLYIEVESGHSIELFTNANCEWGIYNSSSTAYHERFIDSNGATIFKYQGELNVTVDPAFGATTVDSVSADSVSTSVDAGWASSSITVTDDAVGGTVTALPVSVPSTPEGAATSPRADITSGTKVETETITITDTQTGTEVVPDTDTSTQTGFWATVVSWFKTIWQTLKDILAGILAIPIAIVQAIATAAADVIAAIKSLVPEPPSFDDFQIPSLQSFFPFCIPFDLLDMMRALNASPVAPSFTFACPLPGGGVYYVNIDLSAWNGVASTIRSVTMAIYVVVLANSTRKFIKW